MRCEVGAADLQRVPWSSDEVTTLSRLWQPQSLRELIGSFSEQELGAHVEKFNAEMPSLPIGAPHPGVSQAQQLIRRAKEALEAGEQGAWLRSLVRATGFQHQLLSESDVRY